VLPKRPEQKHNHYEQTNGYGGTLDSVSLSISVGAKPSQYTMSEMEGDSFRTLRRYGLILARYQIINKIKFMTAYGFKLDTVNAGCRVVANYIHMATYDEDPSIDTVHLKPLIDALHRPQAPPELAIAALAYAGTDAMATIIASVVDPTYRQRLQQVDDELREMLSSDNSGEVKASATRLNRIIRSTNDTDNYYRKSALKQYYYVCRAIEWAREAIQGEQKEREEADKQRTRQVTKKYEQGKRHTREITNDDDRWARAILSKPELSIAHTGLMGRRIKANKEGKFVRDLGRIISDPEQRIFGRKTRALGGVVVVDCSGSMSLTDEEMKDIMGASSGCTVIAYSDHGNNDGEPNVWLVARMGRQARALPNFPGGNGVDLPALQYGVSLRHGNCPMIWISDTQVTGTQDACSEDLRRETMQYCKKKNIHIAYNCEMAVKLLKRLQRGDRVIRGNYE
jgi:hypothetical protein